MNQKYNTYLKHIIRILLPLLLYWAHHIVQDTVFIPAIQDDAAVRAACCFPALLLFLFPVILFVHGLLCYINKRHKFNLRYWAYGLIAMFLILSAIEFTLRSGVSLSVKLSELLSFLFNLELIWLYAYGMNATREAVAPVWNSKAGIIWEAVSLALILSALIPAILFHYGIITHIPLRTVAPAILSYGLCGLAWIPRNPWGRIAVLIIAILSIIFLFNMSSIS